MKSLTIGNLTAKYPIVQGGMGVGISMHKLAGAVAKAGGVGVISAAQPGFNDENFEKDIVNVNMKALAREIRLAKEIADGNGIIGVNLMVVSNNYEDYVKCCIDSGADIIISGAGLPMNLPKYTDNKIKIAPIVSSAKACAVILQRWAKKNNTTADMIVIEGPKAGGHLGFTIEDAQNGIDMTEQIKGVLKIRDEYEQLFNKKIPVVFGGGVFDKADIEHYLNLGLDGVQMATRFVATEECDADIRFKQAYVAAEKDDVKIVKSPVGMPGRAIYNDFIKGTEGNCGVKRCFNCMGRCNPKQTPYCISQALFNAARGNLDNALIFCGANVWKVKEITTVSKLFEELTAE